MMLMSYLLLLIVVELLLEMDYIFVNHLNSFFVVVDLMNVKMNLMMLLMMMAKMMMMMMMIDDDVLQLLLVVLMMMNLF
jgi:hypothetical protein